MNYKVKDVGMATALVRYWLSRHVICNLLKAEGGSYYALAPNGGWPPMWREICDAFVAGWYAKEIAKGSENDT